MPLDIGLCMYKQNPTFYFGESSTVALGLIIKQQKSQHTNSILIVVYLQWPAERF